MMKIFLIMIEEINCLTIFFGCKVKYTFHSLKTLGTIAQVSGQLTKIVMNG